MFVISTEVNSIFTGPFGERVIRFEDASYEGIECPNYVPCPICFRCENKNTRYPECKRCKIKGDYHTTKEKNSLINKGDYDG